MPYFNRLRPPSLSSSNEDTAVLEKGSPRTGSTTMASTSAQRFAAIDELLLMLKDHVTPATLYNLLFANRRFHGLFYPPFLLSHLGWDPDDTEVVLSRDGKQVSFKERSVPLALVETEVDAAKSQRAFMSLLAQDSAAVRTVSISVICMMSQQSIAALAKLFPNITTLVIQDSLAYFNPHSTSHEPFVGVDTCIDAAVTAIAHMRELTTLKARSLGVLRNEVPIHLYNAAERIAKNVLKSRAQISNDHKLAVTLCFTHELCRRCPVCHNTADEEPSAEQLGVFREELITPMVYLPKKTHNFRVHGVTDHWEWVLDSSTFDVDAPPAPECDSWTTST